MKFCAVICEYNPFHNGHLYQLKEIRRASGCDATLCLMSGNFTQRGEAAVFGKYVRAAHAVACGADVVAELPAAFSVSPAELFAEGAVHLLTSLPSVDALAFGCESGTAADFLTLAAATASEGKAFKSALKDNLKDGESYIRARNAALLATSPDVDEALLSAPNNILGVEYCRALLARKSAIRPLPIPRVGSGYADTDLRRDFSSASALRAALSDGSAKTARLVARNLPGAVLPAARAYTPLPYRQAALCALAGATPERIASTPDCSEGLENKLRAMAKSNPVYDEMVKKCVSKRYTLSRIKRILAQNFLGVFLKDVKEYLAAPLYIKILAVNRARSEEILSALSEGKFPVVARKSDYSLLHRTARECFETDVRANELYNVLSGTYENEFQTLFL